jgi:hypothetical protein
MEVNKKLEICMGFIPTTTYKNDKFSGKKTKSNGISVTVNVLNRNAQQSKNS